MSLMASKPTTYSLHEAGIARMVFNEDYSKFDGTLVNFQDESFAIYGKKRHNSDSTSSDGEIQIDVQMDGCPSRPPCLFDVTVIEGETGNHFVLKRIELNVDTTTTIAHYELKSETMTYKTEEVFVGNRADMEIKNFLNFDLAGKGHTVHVGQMTINFQTAVTPPPTPLRNEDSNESPMDAESEDFLH